MRGDRPLPQDRVQAQRAQIVEASIAVFTELGAEATRVEDLLAAAGVARRTFYKYFRGKEDVLTALYEQVMQELLASIASRQAESGDPIAGLRATLDTYLALHVASPRVVKLLVEQGMRSESPIAPLRRRFRAALVQALADAVRRATGRELDAFVFVHLLSGIEGVSIELVNDKPTPAEVERARAALYGMLDAVLRSASELPAAQKVRAKER
jgi:AcrR family transcriptional regulator